MTGKRPNCFNLQRAESCSRDFFPRLTVVSRESSTRWNTLAISNTVTDDRGQHSKFASATNHDCNERCREKEFRTNRSRSSGGSRRSRKNSLG
jgi:hypothetical protein